MKQASRAAASTHQSGFTLVELMIALLLGLVIVGGVLSLFLASKRSYTTTENVGRLQENGRIAFELMAADIREAGSVPCGVDVPIVNVVNGAPGLWWANLGVQGYEGATVFPGAATGTAVGNRAAGTDAIQIGAGSANGVSVVSHVASSAQFQVNTVDHGLADGTIALVCDAAQGSIFQVTNASPGTNTTVVHNTGVAGVSPGNCTKGLGIPLLCTTNGTPYEYGLNSALVTFDASAWYVGCNGRQPCNDPGGRSLFLIGLGAGAPTAGQELVEGVQDMQLRYLVDGAAAYVDSTLITDWTAVTAVRLTLTLVGPDRAVTTDNAIAQGRLVRTISHTVALRNNVP